MPDCYDDDMSESEWRHAAMEGDAFAFLADPDEDIYTLADGNPMAS